MKASPLGIYLEAHGISQGAFARRLGVKSSVVCRWATGQRIPLVVFANAIERETDGEVPASAWGARPAPAAKGRRPAPRRTAARDLRSA